MNQANVKVSFYLKKSETDASGNCPVMAKLSVGKYSKAAFSVKVKVPQSIWASGRACGRSMLAKQINNQLDELRATALKVYHEQSAGREHVSANDVKNILLGMASQQETLLGYFNRFLNNFEKRVGVTRSEETLKTYMKGYRHIVKFLKEQYNLSDISFTALDRSFIDKYDIHLRTDCHLAPRTIINLTDILKTVIKEAIADGIITSNPFMGYEPEAPKPKRRYLTAEELQRIMTTPLNSSKLYHIRDMFLFSCYTGIAYGDMRLLSKEHLSVAEDGTWWIKSSRKKTGIEFEIPLLDLPFHILNKYSGLAPDGKLLPMYSNEVMNLYLKTIAKICNIDRPLVFHTARHTYATEITLSHCVPLETVSRMLGHTRIETTQIYAKVTDDKIDSDTKNLNEKLAEQFTVVI